MTLKHVLSANIDELTGKPAVGFALIEAVGLDELDQVVVIGAIRDSENQVIFTGPQRVKLQNGQLVNHEGTECQLPQSVNNGGTTSPAEWTYRVTLQLDHQARGQYAQYLFQLESDVDLADVVMVPPAAAALDAPWVEYADQAAAARDVALGAVASIEREEPGGVAGLDEDGRLYDARVPSRLAPEGLAAAMVTQGSAGLLLDALTGVGGAVGDGLVDDSDALEAKLAAVSVYGGTLLLGKHRITRSLMVPAGARLRGRNDESQLILPAGANFPALIYDNQARGYVEDLRVTAAGATVSGASVISVRGAGTDVVLSGVRAEGMFDGFRIEGGVGDTPGIVKRVTLLACHAQDSGQYGYRFDDVDGVEMVACRSVGSGLDGVKLRKKVLNLTVNGGYFTGAIAGDGLDAYAGGGQFTLTGGAVFSGNSHNGVVVKTDDLSLSDPATYGLVRNILIGPIVACDNAGSGVTIHRNNGDVDDLAEPLVQSVTINGLQAHGNGNYGLFINARQVSAVGVHAKRNGLDGIRVQSGARDVDLVACHVAGNSLTTPGARDGIWIAGLRVKVWGGSSNGADVDGAAGDAAVDAATKTQRYGIRIESGSRGCVVAGVTLRNNATADLSNLAPDTVQISNPTDAASAPVLTLPNNQRIFGRKADGSLHSIAYITTGGGLNIGANDLGLSILSSAMTLFGNIGFYGTGATTRIALPAAATDLASAIALVNAIRTELIRKGLTT